MNQLVPPIICEEEEEEYMTTNLRIGFRERQHKRLSESTAISPSPSKKVCPALGMDSQSKPISLTPTTVVASGLDDKPSFIGDIPYHEMRKPFVVSESIIEDSFECPNPSPHCLKSTYIPNQDEMLELLRCTPSFIESSVGHGSALSGYAANFD
ncbi:hypothetical protein PVL29_003744 [Vitis rotundifolia]|uniref:Uncharacterized protein n=1 Tax=Vitis rotundifolia TaxID=103349 RepID=A0AA39E5J9_VITRO|nr:hypothetical protein PVL29_003744 [Vitis rotundifolia]